MTQLDRREAVRTMLGAAALAGAVIVTASAASALPRPQSTPANAPEAIPPIADTDDATAPVHQARWWFSRRRRVVIRRRRRWWW